MVLGPHNWLLFFTKTAYFAFESVNGLLHIKNNCRCYFD